ncbi:MAG: PaaI family thioesterase [Sandaracinaceae bacterium]|nr:PaaI family thioesterase [Sandaracinaceae bacterium]
MSDWLERVRAAREAGDPSPLLERVPYAGFLGLHVAIEQGELIASMRFSDRLIGDSSIPALHGGTLGALLESTAIFTLMWAAEGARLPKTINLTIDYLRSGRARDTFAAATIEKHGRRIANVRAIAWQEDRQRPIASALAHFLV